MKTICRALVFGVVYLVLLYITQKVVVRTLVVAANIRLQEFIKQDSVRTANLVRINEQAWKKYETKVLRKRR